MLHVLHLMFFNIRAHKTITKEEEDNEEKSKLLNDQKIKCNDYFSQACNKTCFIEKNKEVSHSLQL